MEKSKLIKNTKCFAVYYLAGSAVWPLTSIVHEPMVDEYSTDCCTSCLINHVNVNELPPKRIRGTYPNSLNECGVTLRFGSVQLFSVI